MIYRWGAHQWSEIWESEPTTGCPDFIFEASNGAVRLWAMKPDPHLLWQLSANNREESAMGSHAQHEIERAERERAAEEARFRREHPDLAREGWDLEMHESLEHALGKDG